MGRRRKKFKMVSLHQCPAYVCGAYSRLCACVRVFACCQHPSIFYVFDSPTARPSSVHVGSGGGGGVCANTGGPVSLVNAVQNLSDNPPLGPERKFKTRTAYARIVSFPLYHPFLGTAAATTTLCRPSSYRCRVRVYIYICVCVYDMQPFEMNIKGILRGFRVSCCCCCCFCFLSFD